jgi:hypothetical protein
LNSTFSIIIFNIILGVIAVTLIVEMSLRLVFGFGHPLLYVADPQIGYLLAPHQQVRRFGNRVFINQYSMRSLETTSSRSPDSLRILLLGDSIANGGWWTDQPDIISETLRRSLQATIQTTPFQRVEVLNASANSWSPANELAYLQQFGTFEAQVVVLLINTDDLFGTVPTSLPVGRDRNYPDRRPGSAIAEVMFRYLLKSVPDSVMVQSKATDERKALAERDRVGFNLEAIAQIQQIVTQANGQLLLAITPLLREVGASGSRDYEQKARQRLQNFTQDRQIPYVDFLPIFQAIEPSETLYRDHIHLSFSGNQIVNQHLMQQIQSQMGWERE